MREAVFQQAQSAFQRQVTFTVRCSDGVEIRVLEQIVRRFPLACAAVLRKTPDVRFSVRRNGVGVAPRFEVRPRYPVLRFVLHGISSLVDSRLRLRRHEPTTNFANTCSIGKRASSSCLSSFDQQRSTPVRRRVWRHQRSAATLRRTRSLHRFHSHGRSTHRPSQREKIDRPRHPGQSTRCGPPPSVG